jgi:hypothetical protein
MIEDRLHHIIFGVCIYALWRWYKKLPPGKSQTIVSWAVALLTIFLIATVLAGLANTKRPPDTEFRCDVMHTVVSGGAVVDGKTNQTPSMIYHLLVVNNGSASIVRRWKCHAAVDGKSYTSTPLLNPYMPMVRQINAPLGPNLPAKFEPERYLPHMLLENALGPGRAAYGWVAFDFPQLSRKDLESAKITLEIEDSKGARHTNDAPPLTGAREL